MVGYLPFILISDLFMKKTVLGSLLTLVCTLPAHADLVSNVPLDVSRFELMDANSLVSQAQAGNQHAQFFLAKRLQKGEGMAKDSKSAVHWYTKAAEQGVAPAQLNLGIMYLKGEGVPADTAKARVWLEKAAHLGDNRASYALAILDEREQRFVDAYKWYELSSRSVMLDDKVKDKARDKVGQLALNLSSSEIQSAKAQADTWFQNR